MPLFHLAAGQAEDIGQHTMSRFNSLTHGLRPPRSEKTFVHPGQLLELCPNGIAMRQTWQRRVSFNQTHKSGRRKTLECPQVGIVEEIGLKKNQVPLHPPGPGLPGFSESFPTECSL